MEKESNALDTQYHAQRDMKDRFERQIRDIKSERDSYKKERSHIVSQFDLCVSNYDKIKSQITDITQRSDKCTDEKWHLQQRVNT